MRKRVASYLLFLVLISMVFVFISENVSAGCIDTDGGVYYYMNGSANTFQNCVLNSNCTNLTTYHPDICTDLINTTITSSYNKVSNGKVLLEAYCNQTDAKYQAYICPYGCKDGVCLSEVMQSKESECGCGDLSVNSKYEKADKVFSGKLIHRAGYSGNENGFKDYTAVFSVIDTWKGASSDREEEVLVHMLSQTCYTGFGLGKEYIVYSKDGETNLCSGNVLLENNTGETDELETLSKDFQKCTDSDFGLSYTSQGIVSINHFCKSGVYCPNETYTDKCTKLNNNSILEGNTLIEYYCNNNKLQYKTVNCLGGCKNGACIKDLDYCIDNVAKNNLSIKGSIQLNNNSLYDYCKNDSTVVKYSCIKAYESYADAPTYFIPNKYFAYQRPYICSNFTSKCYNGVCVSETDYSELVRNNSLIVEEHNWKKGEIKIGERSIKSEIDIEEGNDSIRTNLTNGKLSLIKVMPETASARAIQRLGLKVCSLENNCTIVLKEAGAGNNTKAVYEVSAEKEHSFLWIFKWKSQVKTEVDAEATEVKDLERNLTLSSNETSNENNSEIENSLNETIFYDWPERNLDNQKIQVGTNSGSSSNHQNVPKYTPGPSDRGKSCKNQSDCEDACILYGAEEYFGTCRYKYEEDKKDCEDNNGTWVWSEDNHGTYKCSVDLSNIATSDGGKVCKYNSDGHDEGDCESSCIVDDGTCGDYTKCPTKLVDNGKVSFIPCAVAGGF